MTAEDLDTELGSSCWSRCAPPRVWGFRGRGTFTKMPLCPAALCGPTQREGWGVFLGYKAGSLGPGSLKTVDFNNL